MGVGIDSSRNKNFIGTVDDLSIFGCDVFGDFCNFTILDEDIGLFRKVRIDDLCVFKKITLSEMNIFDERFV